MSDALDRKLGDEMKRIVGADDETRFVIMTGKVVAGSVDEGEATCDVLLGLDNDADGNGVPMEGVLLNAVSMNSNGLLLYPDDNSDVWVAELDGPGKWGIIKCSNLKKLVVLIGGSKLEVEDGQVTFNGGSNDGLVNIRDLVTQLNALEQDLTALKAAFTALLAALAAAAGAPSTPVLTGMLSGFFSSALTTYAAAAITPTVQAMIEDTSVKH